jgi:hypothetical protein
MEWWRDVLRKEHEAAPDSFVMQVRGAGRWDRPTYERLFQAMLACCKAHADHESVERWIAEVFWYMSWWPGQQPGSRHHENVLTNFGHLAWWLFAKQARGDDEFEPF